MNFTPTYSSWINQVERLFAEVTRDLLQQSEHRSVQALENDLRDWVTSWNENPKPFIWTTTAEDPRLTQQISPTYFGRWTLAIVRSSGVRTGE